MTDARLTRLEEIVATLREDNASLSTSVSHLSATLEKLTLKLDELNNTMNRGRGALWVIVGASSVAGAILASMISSLFAKGS